MNPLNLSRAGSRANQTCCSWAICVLCFIFLSFWGQWASLYASLVLVHLHFFSFYSQLKFCLMGLKSGGEEEEWTKCLILSSYWMWLAVWETNWIKVFSFVTTDLINRGFTGSNKTPSLQLSCKNKNKKGHHTRLLVLIKFCWRAKQFKITIGMQFMCVPIANKLLSLYDDDLISNDCI